MKGDLTRNTFNRGKHYSGVRMQQGRVQLDAEWNEQQDIIAHRAATEAVDAIGPAGAPKHNAAFGIVPDPTKLGLPPLEAGDLWFTPGRFYAGGTLCEVEDYFRLSRQPDFPGAAAISQEGTHLVYLDAWQRHLTAIDDDSIRETALGGPDTTTRTKTVWQVKTKPVTQAQCISDPADWEKLGIVTPSTGQLAARAMPDAASDKPCILPPSAGYRRLENQLYRVEIHKSGPLGTALFKWSRDNGTVVTKLAGPVNGQPVKVDDLGRDEVLGFKPGNWVELLDDANDLNGTPGVLAQIDTIDRATQTVTFKSATFGYVAGRNPKMRRWDGPDGQRKVEEGSAKNDGFLELESGVQVKFSAGYYNIGDYWLIPARTATNSVEWTTKTDLEGNAIKDAQDLPVPAEHPPLGILHTYCRLAIVTAEKKSNNGTPNIPNAAIEITEAHDCRDIFPPLTEIEDPEEIHNRHNRLLHGWGAVCGLQVRCGGGDRRAVQIEPGYALQCDGSEVILPPPGRSFDVVGAARQAGLLKDNSGQVRVTLAAATPDEIVFGVRAPADATGKPFLENLLAGTFWMDVFNDCLEPLVDFVNKQFIDGDPNDKKIVKAPARRLIAALNLWMELVNPASASHVFLSEEEHGLLKDFHDGLKKLLQDPVYCAILDGLPPFPDYPFKSAGILTGFGKEAMTDIRISRDKRLSCAFGGSKAKLLLFNLDKGEMTAEIELPLPAGAGSLQVQDLAFYDQGQRLLVAAITPNGDSVLYRYKIAQEGSKCDPADKPVVVQDLRVLRVAEIPADAKRLYALVENLGLVGFKPQEFSADDFKPPLVQFNPTGHWAFDDAFPDMIFAVGMPPAIVAAQPPLFPPICVIRLSRESPKSAGTITGTIISTITLDGPCTDGLALLSPPRTTKSKTTIASARLYAVLGTNSSPTKKCLVVYTVTKPTVTMSANLPAVQANTLTTVDLETDGEVGLAATADGRFMLVSLANLCQLRWLDPARNEWSAGQTLPVQIHPMDIATNSSVVVVANRDSQTLSMIPAGLISDPSPVTVQAVADYRADLLVLARTLGLRLLQLLKDGLCERLVQNCPVCEPDDLIELACVEIRGGKVHHIANCCRREVVTFPKLKYWLSTVPVLPLLSWAVREFCGLVLPDLFKPRPKPIITLRDKPIAIDVPTNVLGTLRERFTASQFRLAKDNLVTRVSHVTKLVAASAKVEAMAPFKSDIVLQSRDLVDMNQDTVKGLLANSGVEVAAVSDYDQAIASRPWQNLADLQFDFKAGDRVNLLIKDDKVMMITKVRTPAPTGEGVVGSPPELVKKIDRLNDELAQMKQTYDTYVAARKTELAEMRSNIDKIQPSVPPTPSPLRGVSEKQKRTK